MSSLSGKNIASVISRFGKRTDGLYPPTRRQSGGCGRYFTGCVVSADDDGRYGTDRADQRLAFCGRPQQNNRPLPEEGNRNRWMIFLPAMARGRTSAPSCWTIARTPRVSIYGLFSEDPPGGAGRTTGGAEGGVCVERVGRSFLQGDGGTDGREGQHAYLAETLCPFFICGERLLALYQEIIEH